RTVITNYKPFVAEIVSQFGGIMHKFSGDSLVACFGYPEAHEHEPERAIRAGLALVEAVPRSNDAFVTPVHARVGIATGPVAVGDFAEDGAEISPGLLGEPPRLAALLQSIAEPGAVMVAANTRDL